MSQKYTWSEREIAKGNRECMIGLLEDMHILFDGFPPRQTNNYFENGPHIGRIYDHINRKQFYFSKQNEDTLDFVENKENKAKCNNNEIKDFIGKAKKKFGCDLNQERNDSRDLEGEFSEKESDIFLKFNNNQDKVLNTERLYRKHENVPSIINNQIGKDVCSPIAKAKERQYIVDISPKRNEETNSKVELTKAKDEYNNHLNSDMNSLSNENFSKYHNNQMSSKPVSGINSPESYTFLPNRRITEESADYTERSRSEELEELQDIKQEAHKNYTNQKNMFDKFRRNPFSIESSKADIDPFKEIKEDRRNQLKASIEVDEIQQMYDEETILMNRISNLKDFRNIIQDYINLGIRLNDQISLDDESLDDFKDGIILCEIVGLMEGVKVQSVTKNPKSKASCINNIKKALKVLKKKKSIPLYLIYAEQEIYEGNPELVFELLKSIKYAYKHVFKS